MRFYSDAWKGRIEMTHLSRKPIPDQPPPPWWVGILPALSVCVGLVLWVCLLKGCVP